MRERAACVRNLFVKALYSRMKRSPLLPWNSLPALNSARTRFRLTLGAGGKGEVYRAKDAKLGRQVAIKILPAHLAANTSARERLRREAAAAAALDHPYICKVFEIGEQGETLFLVMEFIAGETLHQRLSSGPPPPPAEALRIAGEIAEALEEAHNNRFVHRDLKPANIMLAQGLARRQLDRGLKRVVPTK